MKTCPCGSGQPYGACCGRYHAGALPETAEALMRSRYSAYALRLPEYIIETTHPENPDYNPDHGAWKKKILDFSTRTQFIRLEVLSAEENFVTFNAYLVQENKPFILHEKSRFKKQNGRWLYLSREK